VVVLTHGAFVARAVRRQKHPHGSHQALNGPVDPRRRCPPAALVDEQARLAVVQAAKHDVGGREHAEPQVATNIADDAAHVDLGVEFPRGGGGYLGFETALVALAEQDASRQVRVLDAVHVDHKNVADAKQRECLEQLVAKRPGANHEHPRLREPRLVPPGDELLPVVAPVLGSNVDLQCARGHGVSRP
jgi:hypothetical protein